MNDGDKQGPMKETSVWEDLMALARDVEVAADLVLSGAVRVNHNVKGMSKKDAPREEMPNDDMSGMGFEDDLKACLKRINDKLTEAAKELTPLK